MAQNDSDIGPMGRLWDLPAAIVLLTRLPMPTLPDHAFAHGARAVWAYPLVGLVLGLILAALSGVLGALSLPAAVIAGLTLAALTLLTGAMHEDGLADTADGLWGGHSVERRLDIMKDSRIGAYGVLALVIAMGLRWLGFVDLSWAGVVAALMISRAMMAPLMLALPHARTTGLSHGVGAPTLGTVIAAVLIGVVGGMVFAGGPGLVAACVAGCVTLGMGALARTKIGGQTGDILGATQIVTEIAVLITLLSLAA